MEDKTLEKTSKRKRKKNINFDFDSYHRDKFMQQTVFEEVELLHWSFMGDKFLPEVQHILNQHPEYINCTNLIGDTPLFLSGLVSSYKTFEFLYKYENSNIYHINRTGNLVDNIFFAHVPPEMLQDSYDAKLESKKEEINYIDNTYKICLLIEKDFPDFITQKDKDGNNLLFRILNNQNNTSLYKDKVAGLFLYVLKHQPSLILSLNSDFDNLLFLMAEHNMEWLIRFIIENGGNKYLNIMFTHLNKKGDTIFTKYFCNETIIAKVFDSPFVNFEDVSKHFSYGFIDLFEDLLSAPKAKEILLVKVDNETIFDVLDDYIDIFNQINTDISNTYSDFLSSYFKYVRKTLHSYICN